MAKTEFSWDSEVIIGMIVEGPKVEHDIKICSLNDTQFVIATKRILKKDGWSIAKNQTFKMEVFDKLVDTVAAFKEGGPLND